jgi:hypothetical protein
VALVVDHPGGEALAEERAFSFVASVVLTRVMALIPLDGSRELLGWAFQNGVVVRAHEAVGIEREPEARHGGQEEQEEQPPVCVLAEEHRLVHGVRRDVEIAVRELSTADSCHAANGTGGKRLRRASATLPTHFRHGFASRDECQTLVAARRG